MEDIENEETVVIELERLSSSPQTMTEYTQIFEFLSQNGSGQQQSALNVQIQLEKLYLTDTKKYVEAFINILSLSHFSGMDEERHKFLSVMLGSYIRAMELDSDNDIDRKFLVRCLNKLSFNLFRIAPTETKCRNISIAFAKLLLYHEFFSDVKFSDEVFFRFIKKYMVGCENETQLAKVLTLLNLLTEEDSKILSSNLPKLVNDSLGILGSCTSFLLKQTQATEIGKALECLNKINTTVSNLLNSVVENFPKYSRQSLEIMSNQDFCQSLMEVT